MADTQAVINQLIDAITGSGKSFNAIDKSAIVTFLQKNGIPSRDFDKVYKQIQEYYNPKSKSTTSKQTETERSLTPAVDYSDNSHNDVKVRTPRKSVFNEIVKIGG